MKLGDANALKAGKRQIRAMGDDCNPLCFVWYGCGNSKPDGKCEGFILLDGETRRHLNHMLNEDDHKYIENCVSTIQRGCNTETEEVIVREVLRFIPEGERQPKETGFTAMLTAARSSNPTPQHTEPAEPRSGSGFIGMLESSSKNVSSEDAIQKALDEIKQDEAKYATAIERVIQNNHEDIIPRNGVMSMFERVCTSRTRDEPEPQTRLGFLRMFDITYQQYVENGSVETHDRIPCGFGEMIEAAFPHETPAVSREKPRAVHRGMGFGAMLEGARSGTE